MGAALSWVPWWLMLTVTVGVAWIVVSVVCGAVWSLVAGLFKRAARRRWVRSLHPAITAALRDTPQGRAYGERVAAGVGRHRRWSR